MEREDTAKQLAYLYSDYLKVDISKDVASAEEIVDDTLTRLEELESSITMMQGDDSSEVINCLRDQKTKLMILCEQVHKLETFVSRVAQDVNLVEAKVVEAEYDIKDNSEGKLKNMFKKPLLFMKPDLVSSSQHNLRLQPFEPPKLFQTNLFFPLTTEEQKDDSE